MNQPEKFILLEFPKRAPSQKADFSLITKY